MALPRAREVLGVAPGATSDELKDAFRALAKEWHPDLNPSQEARARFLESRAAFEALIATGTSGGGLGGAGAGVAGEGDARGAGADSSFYRGGGGGEGTAATGTADSSFFRDGEDPWRGLRDGEAPRDFQERVLRERKQQHAERQQAEAEWRSAAARVAAAELDLRRGTLLVATPQMRSFYTMAVVLVIEVDGDYIRGIVVNGGPGGRTGLSDRFVFHSCSELASQPDNPVVPGTTLFVEDYLSKSLAADLIRQLDERGEPHALTQGCTWWRLEQLVGEVQRGDWKPLSWGSAGARWWLSVRSKLTTRTLWRRALVRLAKAEKQE